MKLYFGKLYKYILWCGLIIIVLLAIMPGEYAPDTGLSDKVNHTAAFLVLCLLALRAYPGLYLRSGLWLMLYGTVIEGLQIWIPGRSCSVMDLAADFCGIAAGICFTVIFNHSVKKG